MVSVKPETTANTARSLLLKKLADRFKRSNFKRKPDYRPRQCHEAALTSLSFIRLSTDQRGRTPNTHLLKTTANARIYDPPVNGNRVGKCNEGDWVTGDASVILHEKKSTARKFQKTKSTVPLSNSSTLRSPLQFLEYHVVSGSVWRQGANIKKITHNEIQVTRDQTCSMRAIRTVRKSAHNATAYDSQGHIRRGYRFVGLHLRRLRGHERTISCWLGNLCLPITVPLSVTFRPKLPAH